MLLKGILAVLLSCLCVVLVMPHWIAYLKRLNMNQQVSEYSLQAYKDKEKTPIMGGVIFILATLLVSIIVLQHVTQPMILVLVVFVGYGCIGLVDDALIVLKNNNHGLSAKAKFLMQLALAIIFYTFYFRYADTRIAIPFTNLALDLQWFYPVLILFMLTGSSNAVNLTDGMDGLAGGCTAISLIGFIVFSILLQRVDILVVCCSLLGALIGYLKFNKKPAKIFMGDTGSLALGAFLAITSIVLKKEIALIFVGGIFVVETLCVMIQIGSVKLRHKRVFPYTPIHYTFTLKGMKETDVVRNFWLVSCLFVIIGITLGIYS